VIISKPEHKLQEAVYKLNQTEGKYNLGISKVMKLMVFAEVEPLGAKIIMNGNNLKSQQLLMFGL
jgi:hypothetical protein